MSEEQKTDFDLAEFRLDGRVALVTGAGRGIGLGIARGFAAAGCAVAIQDIDFEVAEAECAKIIGQGGRALPLGGDIRDIELGAQLVQDTIRALGRIDILVNNASIQADSDWLELDAAEFEAQLRADLIVPALFAQAAVPHFRAARYGRILNIGSIQTLRGQPLMLPYVLSKTGLEGLTKSLAQSEAKHGITVNTLSPGWFDTYRNEESLQSEANKTEIGKKRIPLGRLGQPRDCAGLALLLCSPAGAYITGQTIFVDGGISVR